MYNNSKLILALIHTIIFVVYSMKKKKISKYIRKYANAFEFLDLSLSFLSLAGGGVTIRSFTPFVFAPVRFIAYFITLFFMTSNNYAKLFLNALRNMRRKHKQFKIQVKSRSNRIETKILKAIQVSIVSETKLCIY